MNLATTISALLTCAATLLSRSLLAAEPAAPFDSKARPILVFAASSLADSLRLISQSWERETGIKVRFNFAASSVLARQIQEGAPADLFFSADEAKADALDKEGLLVSETRKTLLSNLLVLIVAADSKLEIRAAEDLASPKVKRIALGDPKAVPVGIYAREYLEHLHLWPAVAPKVVPTENARAALAAVESGNIDAGIVFQTDASVSKKVKIAFQVPREAGPKISYPAAVVKGSRQPAAARKFLDYLASETARKIFRQYGFIVLSASARSAGFQPAVSQTSSLQAVLTATALTIPTPASQCSSLALHEPPPRSVGVLACGFPGRPARSPLVRFTIPSAASGPAASKLSQSGGRLLPLPEGEGWGEGEFAPPPPKPEQPPIPHTPLQCGKPHAPTRAPAQS